MSLTSIISRPCLLLLRSPTTDADKYGSEQPDEDGITTVCELQQHQRSEPADEGELGVAVWDVFFLADSAAANASTGDAVVIDGHTYEFIGPPWVANTGRAVAHIEVTAKRVAGGEETGS